MRFNMTIFFPMAHYYTKLPGACIRVLKPTCGNQISITLSANWQA